MSALKDIAGKQFGRLIVLRRAENHPITKRAMWLCRCSCGREIVANGVELRNGHTQSCGCFHRDRARAANIGYQRGLRHGHTHSRGHVWKSPEYSAWSACIARCTNPRHHSFKKYGGGNPAVLICDRWRSFFENFLADLGKRPSSKHSLSRFLDSGNYEPGNCEWGSTKQQAAEKKGKNATLRYRAARLAGRIVWEENLAAKAA